MAFLLLQNADLRYRKHVLIRRGILAATATQAALKTSNNSHLPVRRAVNVVDELSQVFGA